MQQHQIEGVVISSTGSWYEVATESGTLNCRIRGRLRLKGIRSTNPVVVGDRVIIEPDGDSSVITGIIPRRNYIIRRASNLSKESHIIAANIDHALLIVTLCSPTTPREFVDRFLVTCEAYKVPVTIVLGKADLIDAQAQEEAEEFTAIYNDAG
jgi:ribosome biogenesis GTPase